MLFFACSWDFCVDICHNSSQHEPSQSRKQGELKPNTNTICKKENNEDPTASPRRSAGGYLRAESIPLLLPGASWSCHGGDWSAWGRMECSSRGDTTKILKRKWYWKEKKRTPAISGKSRLARKIESVKWRRQNMEMQSSKLFFQIFLFEGQNSVVIFWTSSCSKSEIASLLSMQRWPEVADFQRKAPRLSNLSYGEIFKASVLLRLVFFSI